MITEKHGRTTVYKCGKRFEKKPKEKLDRGLNQFVYPGDEVISDKPESKPDKKKYKNSREG